MTDTYLHYLKYNRNLQHFVILKCIMIAFQTPCLLTREITLVKEYLKSFLHFILRFFLFIYLFSSTHHLHPSTAAHVKEENLSSSAPECCTRLSSEEEGDETHSSKSGSIYLSHHPRPAAVSSLALLLLLSEKINWNSFEN